MLLMKFTRIVTMLLMSKNLEDRIGDAPQKEDSVLFFGDEKFPCSLLKTEVDLTENRKTLRIKVPIQVMDHIYNDKIPTGLNHQSGKKVEFKPSLVYKVSCSKTETLSGNSVVLTMEVAQ